MLPSLIKIIDFVDSSEGKQ